MVKEILLAISTTMLCLTTTARAALSDYTTMQIVAHEDDDILFMNLELRNMLAAGYGCVTVYLTAGEADGTLDGTQDREYFAASRQEGERAAYAAMMGVPNVPGTWDRSTLAVRNGNLVEVDALVAAPQVKLIFVNLPDDGDDLQPPENQHALYQLYDNQAPSKTTIVPTGTPITQSYTYTRSDLLGSIIDLLNRYRPSIVRTLDPQPYQAGSNPNGTCEAPPPLDYVSPDNTDHTFATYFVNEALASYKGRTGNGHTSILYYKGYSIAQHQGNLGPVEYTDKRSICDAYKQWDHNFQDTENCYNGFFGATYERYPNNTTWLVKQSNNLLGAFAVENRKVVLWQEQSVGGAWRGPITLGGGPVGSHLAVATRPDGRLQVFALKTPHQQDHDPLLIPSSAPLFGIITATQASVGSQTFSAWQSLGAPNATQCRQYPGCHFVGVPAVAANADGRLQLFIKNNEGGVSTKWELTGGGWSSWLDLGGGPDILEGLAAITSAGGRIELFASTRLGRIARWRQIAPNDIFTYSANFPTASAPITNAAGPPTVAYNQNGRLQLFYREQGSARVRTLKQSAVDGAWPSTTVNLYGDAGTGPVTAFRHSSSGLIMIFERNAYGGVSGTRQKSVNSSFNLQWVDYGGLIPHFPSACVDGNGRTVLATTGIDGRLYLRRQQSNSATSVFDPWTAVGL